MATRFGKKIFTTQVVNNHRLPILTTQNPDPGDVENPDPGGSGGSGGDGVDIGTISGGGLSSTSMPTITRKAHSQRIYLAKGATMSITYVATGLCTMMPKGGPHGMTTTYSSDGREMTLTWTCPSTFGADSTYIGVEAFVWGDGISVQYFVLWDQLHIGKTSSDIIDSVDQTLKIELARMRNPNDTLVIEDGTKSSADDYIAVGSSSTGQPFNNLYPVNGAYTTSGSGLTRNHIVSSFAVIMAETPLGVVLDRQGRRGGVVLSGNRAEGEGYDSGLRSTIGIKAKGFLVYNGGYGGLATFRAEKCAIDWCYNVQDLRSDLATGWTGDGSAISHRHSGDCNSKYSGALANERLLNAMTYRFENASYRCQISQNMSTQACVQFGDQVICQDFSSYGSRKGEYINCLAVDDFIFANGIYSPSGTAFANFNFINTNSGNEDTLISRCMGLNTIKSFFRNDVSETQNDSYVKHSASWHKKYHQYGEVGAVFVRQKTQYTNCANGFNNNVAGGISSSFYEMINGTIDNHLVVNGRATTTFTDLVLAGQGTPTIDNFGIVNPPAEINTALSGLDSFFSYFDSQTAGVKYITRPEPGLAVDIANQGPRDWMCAEGEYFSFAVDNDHTVYNGQGGNPYVNWIQRGPWYEIQQARQRFNHTDRNGNTYSGNSGISETGVHPVDYLNRFSTKLNGQPNCPYIEDIYGVLVGANTVRLFWRPVCLKFRTNITGYDIYVNGVRIAENQDRSFTYFEILGLSSGDKDIWLVCKNNIDGDSGRSRIVSITIP